MSEARTEISCRVDGITGRAAKRHTDNDNQQSHRDGSDTAETDLRRISLLRHEEYHENKHECADNLAQEITLGIVDSRNGGKDAELVVPPSVRSK